jgi:hypothetical protein
LAAIDTELMTGHFRDWVLSELVSRGLITGDPFEEEDRTRFVARYIERGPLLLEKLSITDDVVSYPTRDGRTPQFVPETWRTLSR